MNTVFLLTGGNIGNRLDNLRHSCHLLERQVGHVTRKSSVYETAAWGVTEQPSFLNQVLCIESNLHALDVLRTILAIEETMGRKRVEKMGPRTIDIDILFYNADVILFPNLVVPHPQIANRRFVLVPLLEIAPQLYHPTLKRTIAELLIDCPDTLEVNLYKPDK